MRRSQGFLIIVAATVLTVAAVASADIADADGVPHVRNGAEPRDGVETVRLEELWRAGDNEDDGLLDDAGWAGQAQARHFAEHNPVNPQFPV